MDEDKKTIVDMIVQKYQLIEDKPFEINRGKRKAIFSERFMLHNNQIYTVRTYLGCIERKKFNNMDQVVGMLLFRDDLEIEYIQLRPIPLLPEDINGAIRYVANRIDESFEFWTNYNYQNDCYELVFSLPYGYAIPVDKKVALDIQKFACKYKLFQDGSNDCLKNTDIDALLKATTDEYEIKIEE